MNRCNSLKFKSLRQKLRISAQNIGKDKNKELQTNNYNVKKYVDPLNFFNDNYSEKLDEVNHELKKILDIIEGDKKQNFSNDYENKFEKKLENKISQYITKEQILEQFEMDFNKDIKLPELKEDKKIIALRKMKNTIHKINVKDK